MVFTKNLDGKRIYTFLNASNILIGSSSKKKRYDDTVFFKKIMSDFKNNILQSDKLVIIGYGGKDYLINDIITECFKKNKLRVTYVAIDPTNEMKTLASDLGTNILNKSIADVTAHDFYSNNNT